MKDTKQAYAFANMTRDPYTTFVIEFYRGPFFEFEFFVNLLTKFIKHTEVGALKFEKFLFDDK